MEHEAYIAELQAAALELLTETKFPFTHAAYVLGLNGPYYSLDTIAEKHYGIPKTLPSLLCALFRASVPGVAFTTLRVQKFAAAANFGGQHRTLAFSLSPPARGEEETEEEHEILSQEGSPRSESPADAREATHLMVSTGPGLPGHVLCLTEGCLGGHGEVCDDPRSGGAWRWLAGPQRRGRFAPFAADAWLRWHWPRFGDLYALTVTCESLDNCLKLRRRELRQMAEVGFLLPEGAMLEANEASDGGGSETCGDYPSPSSHEASDGDGSETCGDYPSPSSHEAAPTPPAKPNAARVAAAKRLLGLDEDLDVSAALVEEAFRRTARQVHPDRAASESPIPASWLMSQLTWARRILREAAAYGVGESTEQEAAAQILMLAAPDPE